jgi:hypothetical protein
MHQDLSLLTNLTHEDISKLQTVGKEEQAKRKEFILRDDSPEAWEALKAGNDDEGKSESPVAIILDNGEGASSDRDIG